MTHTQEEIFFITEAMIRFGGNFYKYLAGAIRYADPVNKKTIFDAFPAICDAYGPGTNFYNTVLSEHTEKL